MNNIRCSSSSSISQSWWNRWHLHSADTFITFSSFLDSEVSLFSPAGSPRVLQDPFVWIVSYQENSMVKVSSTVCWDDSSSVWLEGSLISFNQNSDGIGSNISLHLAWAVCFNWNISASAKVDNSFSVVWARLVNSFVWVSWFLFMWGWDQVGHGSFGPSSITSITGLDTVN